MKVGKRWNTPGHQTSRDEGVDVRTGVTVAEVRGKGHVDAVVLTDGTELPADLVVVGI
ncbi:FAD-dependent oxidoreductase, partial [Mycobacterium tuberculosis]|uniref:FAD-dependent oxidoreductase n=1 Tax=Mycobacterium tuberculosis TaxID=1773 RepID=UPI001F486DFB